MAKKKKIKENIKPVLEHAPEFEGLAQSPLTAEEPNPYLPGYLLIALGLLALPLNFGLIDALEFAKAWPLLMVIFGFVLIAKVKICKIKGIEI